MLYIYTVKPIINSEPPSLAFWNENVPLLCFDVLWWWFFIFSDPPHPTRCCSFYNNGGWLVSFAASFMKFTVFFLCRIENVYDAYVNHVCIYDFHFVFRFFLHIFCIGAILKRNIFPKRYWLMVMKRHRKWKMSEKRKWKIWGKTLLMKREMQKS